MYVLFRVDLTLIGSGANAAADAVDDASRAQQRKQKNKQNKTKQKNAAPEKAHGVVRKRHIGHFFTGWNRTVGVRHLCGKTVRRRAPRKWHTCLPLKPLCLLCRNQGWLRHRRVICLSQRENVPPIQCPARHSHKQSFKTHKPKWYKEHNVHNITSKDQKLTNKQEEGFGDFVWVFLNVCCLSLFFCFLSLIFCSFMLSFILWLFPFLLCVILLFWLLLCFFCSLSFVVFWRFSLSLSSFFHYYHLFFPVICFNSSLSLVFVLLALVLLSFVILFFFSSSFLPLSPFLS